MIFGKFDLQILPIKRDREVVRMAGTVKASGLGSKDLQAST